MSELSNEIAAHLQTMKPREREAFFKRMASEAREDAEAEAAAKADLSKLTLEELQERVNSLQNKDYFDAKKQQNTQALMSAYRIKRNEAIAAANAPSEAQVKKTADKRADLEQQLAAINEEINELAPIVSRSDNFHKLRLLNYQRKELKTAIRDLG